jgi:hypothetical protein
MTKRTRKVIINGMPAATGKPRTRKAQVTDRAQRYRANQPGIRPKGKQCAKCGSTRNIVVNHKNGNESDTHAGNLNLLCKSCNGKEAARHKAAGQGRRTAQYNPKKKAKKKQAKPNVPTYGQYGYAVSIHDKKSHAHDEGGAIIHATPKALRRQYAREMASTKRWRGTATTRRKTSLDDVPF